MTSAARTGRDRNRGPLVLSASAESEHRLGRLRASLAGLRRQNHPNGARSCFRMVSAESGSSWTRGRFGELFVLGRQCSSNSFAANSFAAYVRPARRPLPMDCFPGESHSSFRPREGFDRTREFAALRRELGGVGEVGGRLLS